jgi:hypothetical protein
MGIVIEEADETLYWLEMIRDGLLLAQDPCGAIIRECEELLSIFVASQMTARKKATSS